MIKFTDITKTKVSSCQKCFALLYALPCQLDNDIVDYLKGFGPPVYPVNSVSFLRIDTADGFHIEGKMKAKLIKFSMPKKFRNTDLDSILRKKEFEKGLIDWMSKKLKISISHT